MAPNFAQCFLHCQRMMSLWWNTAQCAINWTAITCRAWARHMCACLGLQRGAATDKIISSTLRAGRYTTNVQSSANPRRPKAGHQMWLDGACYLDICRSTSMLQRNSTTSTAFDPPILDEPCAFGTIRFLVSPVLDH
jgi:hypothetical protein